jgi:acyl carrier protein
VPNRLDDGVVVELPHANTLYHSHAAMTSPPAILRAVDAALVLDVVQSLVTELDPVRAGRAIRLDDSLTRELALGSLERVELLLRLEQATGVRLEEAVLAEADSPRHLLQALLAQSTAPASDRHEPSGSPGPSTAADQGPGRVASASARTLLDVLRWHVDATPDRVHIYLREEDGRERPITYGGLWRDAASVAAGLVARRVAPGDRVALLLRTEVTFFQAYFGVLLAGGVPVLSTRRSAPTPSKMLCDVRLASFATPTRTSC